MSKVFLIMKTGINQFLSPGTIVIDMSTISSTSSIADWKNFTKKTNSIS